MRHPSTSIAFYKLAFTLVVLVLGFFLNACGGGSSANNTTSPYPTPSAPQPRGPAAADREAVVAAAALAEGQLVAEAG